ncbi:MAG TPA: ABC transporter permease, partial [Acidimicrobiia bacterium]|nr:ABC transporter permease [Acidimicrobiia bacterium]
WGWELEPNTFGTNLAIFFSNFYVLNTLVTGQWVVFRDAVQHLILPALALATIPMAIIARITRSSLLDVMGSDYIRTARAKGAVERRVVIHHGLRNSLLPVVTIGGLQLGLLLGGAVLTETVFSLAGVGSALVDAIFSRDFPVIQGFTLVVALIFVIVNLAVDVSYAYLDPRIRHG